MSERKELTFNAYQALALRTARTDLTPNQQLNNATLGLAGEAGEFADELKKVFYQGHEPDGEKLLKELGDLLWYVNLATVSLGSSLEEVAALNLDKLRNRYPDKFDPERSKNREEYHQETDGEGTGNSKERLN